MNPQTRATQAARDAVLRERILAQNNGRTSTIGSWPGPEVHYVEGDHERRAGEPLATLEQEFAGLLVEDGIGKAKVVGHLEATGTTLLKRDEWPPRDDDATRHRALAEAKRVAFLKENDNKLTPEALEHLAYMNLQANAVRFRPEETAASASIQPLPVSFGVAVDAAKVLLEEYDKTFPPPTPPAPPPTTVVPESAPPTGLTTE